MLRRYLPKSLYARILVIVILPIILIESVVAFVFFDAHWRRAGADLSADTAGAVALLVRLYDERPDAAARQALEQAAHDDLGASVRYEPGGALPAADKTSPLTAYGAKLLRHALDSKLDAPFWINTRSWPRYVEIRVATKDGVLVALVRREQALATGGPAFALWLVGATVLLGSIAIAFLRNQVRSILRLAKAAEAFGHGRDSPNFRPSGASEIRRAGRAVIAMRDRLKRNMHQRGAMLAGFSHDLRTPLTRMKLALALRDDDPDIAGLKDDIAEMERMVDAYLTYARDVNASDAPEPVDVSALAASAVAKAGRGGQIVDAEIAPGLIVQGRRDALARALDNLVDNARKYAPHAWLTAAARDDVVEIAVEDDGPGLAPGQFEEAFKPFVRLNAGPTAGVGLGLAIVREIARSHGGDATLALSEKGGLRAMLRLPLGASVHPADPSARRKT